MMLEAFHLVVANVDVNTAASEYVLEQMQVVGKTLEVLEIVGLLAVSVTHTHPPVVEFRVVNADVNALEANPRAISSLSVILMGAMPRMV